jgi:hypothetical protein
LLKKTVDEIGTDRNGVGFGRAERARLPAGFEQADDRVV